MAELKTKPTAKSAAKFIDSVKDPQRRADGKELLRIFKKATGMKPMMWGTAIVGYGMFHYKSERSSQEGDWPLVGFSPRVQNMTVYAIPGFKTPAYEKIMKKMGKYTTSKACLYFKRLSDIHEPSLVALIKLCVKDMQKRYKTKRT